MTSKKSNSSKKSKSKLYTDDHPTLSLKGTGFKDAQTANKTIKLIEKRSLKYQYDVVNTMYNRAKYHPHQTQEMIDAMKIFKKWLQDYKKKKEEEPDYKFLPLSTVLKYEKIAKLYGVSKVARGLMPSTKTDEGFLKVYKKVQSPHKLQYIPVMKNKPEGQDYYSFRNSFIKSRLGQMKASKTPLFYTEGKYKGLPTKQHIILIMYAYSPVINDHNI
jgi:hypothetical protein